MEPLAQVLANLGVKRGMVVCGGDGLDEATLTGLHVCEIRFGQLSSYDMTPEELGLTACKLEELIGGTPQENAAITRDILSGRLTGPKRDVVVLNAAISLYLGIDDCTVKDCIKKARDIIDSGAAIGKMEEFIRPPARRQEPQWMGRVKRRRPHDTGQDCRGCPQAGGGEKAYKTAGPGNEGGTCMCREP